MDKINVLKISNVDFPQSRHVPASFEATYDKDIAEFTVCIRFLIESYNNGLFSMVQAKNKDQLYFLDRIGWETGMERDGFQGGVMMLLRVIPGGGLGGVAYPQQHHFNIPKNIATSKER